MIYSADREDENPVFDDCPNTCDAEQRKRITFCEQCPIGIARDEFKTEATAELDRMSTDDNGKVTPSPYTFDYLYRCLVDVFNLGEPGPNETMTTTRLRSIIEGERSRIARVKRWNKRQQDANK